MAIKKYFEENCTRKLIILIAEGILVFGLLYFTFIEPTFLIYIPYFVGMPVYLGILLIIVVAISFLPYHKHNLCFASVKFIIISAIVGVLFLGYFGVQKIKECNKTLTIKSFIESSDVLLPYNESTFYCGGIDGFDFEHNMIMIDYDSKKVAFLMGSGLDNFQIFSLSEGNAVGSSNIQFQKELEYPGKSITTFYPDELNHHRTSAIQVVMADGKIYNITEMKERLIIILF